MDIQLSASSCEVSVNNSRSVSVYLNDVDEIDVLREFSAEQICDYFDHEDLLKHIDVSTVKKYFDLTESE